MITALSNHRPIYTVSRFVAPCGNYPSRTIYDEALKGMKVVDDHNSFAPFRGLRL